MCVYFSPVLQSAPATVGVARLQTVVAAPPLVAFGHFHPEHLRRARHETHARINTIYQMKAESLFSICPCRPFNRELFLSSRFLMEKKCQNLFRSLKCKFVLYLFILFTSYLDIFGFWVTHLKKLKKIIKNITCTVRFTVSLSSVKSVSHATGWHFRPIFGIQIITISMTTNRYYP